MERSFGSMEGALRRDVPFDDLWAFSSASMFAGGRCVSETVMTQRELFATLIDKYLKMYANEEIYRHTKLAFAQLGNHAGMAGAFAYWMDKEGIPYAKSD